jgi:hypothetical protein
MNLTDAYRVLSGNSTIYILLSITKNFLHIYYILGHKTILNKHKKIEITPCLLSDHNVKKFNNKRNSKKYLKTWRLNKTLLHDQWVVDEIKKFLELNENESTTYQNLWGTAKAVPRGKFIAMTILQSHSNKNSMELAQK